MKSQEFVGFNHNLVEIGHKLKVPVRKVTWQYNSIVHGNGYFLKLLQLKETVDDYLLVCDMLHRL